MSNGESHTYQLLLICLGGYASICFALLCAMSLPRKAMCFRVMVFLTFIFCCTAIAQKSEVSALVLLLRNVSAMFCFFQMHKGNQIYTKPTMTSLAFFGQIYVIVVSFVPLSKTNWPYYLMKLTYPILTLSAGFIFVHEFLYLSLILHLIYILFIIGLVPHERENESDIFEITGLFGSTVINSVFCTKEFILPQLFEPNNDSSMTSASMNSSNNNVSRMMIDTLSRAIENSRNEARIPSLSLDFTTQSSEKSLQEVKGKHVRLPKKILLRTGKPSQSPDFTAIRFAAFTKRLSQLTPSNSRSRVSGESSDEKPWQRIGPFNRAISSLTQNSDMSSYSRNLDESSNEDRSKLKSTMFFYE